MDKETKEKAIEEERDVDAESDIDTALDSDSKMVLTNEEKTELKNEHDENEKAQMMAEADKISRSGSRVDLQQRIFSVRFGKTYKFSGKEYDRVDLSGLDDLTTIALQRVDRIAEKMDVNMDVKIMDTLWVKHIAMEVTGLPLEFFNQLRARDMLEISAVIKFFFVFG